MRAASLRPPARSSGLRASGRHQKLFVAGSVAASGMRPLAVGLPPTSTSSSFSSTNPTTTQAVAPTSVDPGETTAAVSPTSAGRLPATGGSASVTTRDVGVLLLVAGLVIVLVVRRRSRSDDGLMISTCRAISRCTSCWMTSRRTSPSRSPSGWRIRGVVVGTCTSRRYRRRG
jgi:hypothetical protein